MILLTSPMTAQPAAADLALAVCKPVLARKAGGRIDTIRVTSSRMSRKGQTIEGRLTAFQGMGSPSARSASTHHLIRVQFTYRCLVRGAEVRAAAVNLLRP